MGFETTAQSTPVCLTDELTGGHRGDYHLISLVNIVTDPVKYGSFGRSSKGFGKVNRVFMVDGVMG